VIKNRICHITTVHPRYDVRIFHKECLALKENFDDIHLIVADSKGDETKNGIIFHDIGQNTSRIKRVFKNKKKIKRIIQGIDAEIYHIHDPELLLCAKILKKNGAKVIYDSHEDVPRQILNKTYIPKPLRKLISSIFERKENRIISKISGVVTATPYIRERFLANNKNTTDINNFPIINHIKFNDKWDSKSKTVGYVGGIFKTRGIFESLDSIKGTDIEFLLAGKFAPESLENECKEHESWKNVNYLGFIDRSQINDFMSKIRLGFVILEATPSYIVSLPVKMFEYMAAGIPFIASDFEYWKEVVKEDNCGFFVDQNNPDEIKKLIKSVIGNETLLKELGANGRKAVETKYNWEIEKRKLFTYYENLLN
jgi:glycosyltransferase involved in cell wall biosynthesis